MTDMTEDQINDVLERADKFAMHELPGQPMATHMGTRNLVRDLEKAVLQLRRQRDYGQRELDGDRAQVASLVLDDNGAACEICGPLDQDFINGWARFPVRNPETGTVWEIRIQFIEREPARSQQEDDDFIPLTDED